MKRIVMVVILVLSINLVLFGNEVLTKTLGNGMTLAVKENTNNSSVGFYCFVKTGSVSEGRFLGAGISHYLEHVVSGGTTSIRTEAEYEALGTEIGSIVNAYTTNEITAYHIIVDKEYKDDALAILSEQIQFCDFNPVEVEREKQVILKEIVMRSTPPRSQIYHKSNEIRFPNSNYRYPVIGYTDLYKTITRDQLQEYYQQRYTPNNMVFVAVGDFDSAVVMEELINTFQDFPRQQIQPVYLPIQNIRNGDYEFIEEFATEMPLAFINYIVPAADYGDYIALTAAFEILFDNRKSPIRYKLTEDLKLVNYVYGYNSISATAPEGSIQIGFEAKNNSDLRDIVKIIDEEIEKFSISGFQQEDIQNIANKRKASRLLSTPGVQSECNRIGWSLIRYGVPDTYDAMQKKYEELSVEDLQNVLKKHILPQNRTVLYCVSEGSKDEMNKTENTDIVKTEPEKYELKDNITLIHKYNNEKPLIKCVMHLPFSSNYENEENNGLFSLMTNMIFSGSKNYEPLDISEWLEDHAVRFTAYTNSNGTRIEFKCLTDDYAKMKDIVVDAFTNPTFPDSEFQLLKENKEARYMRSLNDAGDIHDDFLKSVLYNDTRDGLSVKQELDIVMNSSREDIISIYQEYFKTNSIIVTFFGDIPYDTAEKEAKEFYQILPHGEIELEEQFYNVPILNDSYVNTYELEQVNVDVNCTAPSINDADFDVMKVIESILNGSRGRVHKAVRGTNDLAYFAFPSYGFNQESGYFRLSSQTSLDKKDELIEVLSNELDKLRIELTSREEIDLALDERQKILTSYLNDNQLPGYMTYYQALGLGYNFIFTSSDRLKEVTPEDIQRVAEKYFSNKAVIVSIPSENVDLIVE
jgi:zinc protease